MKKQESVVKTVNGRAYRVHQVQADDGSLIWIEAGLNPDNVFNDRRKSAWPFSSILADLICQKISEGSSLTKICHEPGMPSYGIVCRWRREQSEFNLAVQRAYQDRSEYLRDKVLEIADTARVENVAEAKLMIDSLKWAASVDYPARYSNRSEGRQHSQSVQIVVETGITRLSGEQLK